MLYEIWETTYIPSRACLVNLHDDDCGDYWELVAELEGSLIWKNDHDSHKISMDLIHQIIQTSYCCVNRVRLECLLDLCNCYGSTNIKHLCIFAICSMCVFTMIMCTMLSIDLHMYNGRIRSDHTHCFFVIPYPKVMQNPTL